MFGHDDNQQQQPQDNTNMMQAAMPDPIPDSNLSGGSAPSPTVGQPSGGSMGAPVVLPSPDFRTPELTSTGTPDLPSAPTNLAPVTDDASAPDASPQSDDLLNLKQQALQSLSPLVSHLDQTPEEKFRTTMMMIQASDDQSLIKGAFEAAQLITDDKARAQALLDVINEINYFTQHTSN